MTSNNVFACIEKLPNMFKAIITPNFPLLNCHNFLPASPSRGGERFEGNTARYTWTREEG